MKTLKNLLWLTIAIIAINPLVIGILNKIPMFSGPIRHTLPWLPWEHEIYFLPIGATIILTMFLISISIEPTE